MIEIVPTGVPNLNAVLGGGIPAYSLNVIAGAPGTGKTILAQQILFDIVRRDPDAKVLYVGTLSEPMLKTVRYLNGFDFFDPDVFEERVVYRDVGGVIRNATLNEVAEHLMGLVRELRPMALVIDSFKAIHDLMGDAKGFRAFVYDLSVLLAGSRCTTFLVGEWDVADAHTPVEFAVADGIIGLDSASESGERRRFLQVHKLRGAAQSLRRFPFAIDRAGIRVLSPALTLGQRVSGVVDEGERLGTGIDGLDALLGGGIPKGRSILLSGVSGTGKTICAMRFLVAGAERGERGLLVSFEESPDRLRRVGRSFGWDLERFEDEGLLRILFVPQPDIRVEEHLDEIARLVDGYGPVRLIVDSFSVFLHRVADPAVQREKAYQFATLTQRAGAIGLFIADIPADTGASLSRFGVEETVADGTIVLTSVLEGLLRKRYVEVYKMRGADHVPGRHRLEIGPDGPEVFYFAPLSVEGVAAPPRLRFGLVDDVLPDGVPYGSCWLVRGDPGAGKSTVAHRFAAEGLAAGESVLYVAADTPGGRILEELATLGVDVRAAVEDRRLAVLDTHPAGGSIRVDLRDRERFVFEIERWVRTLPGTTRVITDSLTPFAVQYGPGEFVTFAEIKNRLLRRPGVVVLDTISPRTLEEAGDYTLRTGYDVVIDVGPSGHEAADGERTLRVRTARGSSAAHPAPTYRVTRDGNVSFPEEGLRVHRSA